MTITVGNSSRLFKISFKRLPYSKCKKRMVVLGDLYVKTCEKWQFVQRTLKKNYCPIYRCLIQTCSNWQLITVRQMVNFGLADILDRVNKDLPSSTILFLLLRSLKWKVKYLLLDGYLYSTLKYCVSPKYLG